MREQGDAGSLARVMSWQSSDPLRFATVEALYRYAVSF